MSTSMWVCTRVSTGVWAVAQGLADAGGACLGPLESPVLTLVPRTLPSIPGCRHHGDHLAERKQFQKADCWLWDPGGRAGADAVLGRGSSRSTGQTQMSLRAGCSHGPQAGVLAAWPIRPGHGAEVASPSPEGYPKGLTQLFSPFSQQKSWWTLTTAPRGALEAEAMLPTHGSSREQGWGGGAPSRHREALRGSSVCVSVCLPDARLRGCCWLRGASTGSMCLSVCLCLGGRISLVCLCPELEAEPQAGG